MSQNLDTSWIPYTCKLVWESSSQKELQHCSSFTASLTKVYSIDSDYTGCALVISIVCLQATEIIYLLNENNDFDKSVIKYMHEMSMPVLYKTKFWYKTRIDTPSLVSAAPQEDLIYWQEWQKTHTKQTTKHRHIPFHSFSSQFILFYYFNWPDNHYSTIIEIPFDYTDY